MQVFFKRVIRKTVEEMEEKIRNITRNFKYNKLMNSMFCKLLEKCCVQNSDSKEPNILPTVRGFLE